MNFQATLTNLDNDEINSYLVSTHIAKECFDAIAENKLDTENKTFLLEVNITSNFHASTRDLVTIKNQITSPKLAEDIYPIAVRYIDKNNNYYIERPPFQAEVDLALTKSRKANGKKSLPYKIWVPWTITVFNPNNTNEVKIYFSDKSLNSFDDLYVECMLPNTYNDSRICFGNSLSLLPLENDTSIKDIRYLYSLIFNEYMNGGWNLDLYPNIGKYLQSGCEKSVTADNYPMINKFINPDKATIKKLYPKMTSLQLERMNFDSFGYHNANTFKYFFLQLSTFSLEETLAFYSELAEYGKRGKNSMSFSKIIEYNKLSKNDIKYTYTNSHYHIKNVLTEKNVINYENCILKKFYLIVNNFTNSNSSNFSSFRYNLNYDLYRFIAKVENYSSIMPAILDFLNEDIESNSNRKVHVLDADTKELTHVYIDEGMTLSDFYVEYAKGCESLPEQENDSQNTNFFETHNEHFISNEVF